MSLAERIFTPRDLPPESEVREGAVRFVANVSAIFDIVAPSELETLLNEAYRSSACVDVLSLCEICALASVGSQYSPVKPRLNIEKSLYRTAVVHLRQCLEINKPRAIRVLVCLACYDIVEHSEAAQLSIGKDTVR